MTRNALRSLVAFAVLAATGCAVDTGSEEDLTTGKNLPVGKSLTLAVDRKTAGPVQITVDCSPPGDPDDVGPVISVAGADFGASKSDPARAGYWVWAGNLGAGSHALTLQNVGAITANCKSSIKALDKSQTCTSYGIFRSPNTHHTHFYVGQDTSTDWESLPASGNHWGAWAKWGTVYAKPVKKGFFLHNLEHGGLVLSYNCSSDKQSAACQDAAKQLASLANDFGQGRVVITPDPTQKKMFVIRSWRWAYAADCLNGDAALEFMSRHYRHGREDIDANSPIPFDPTTTNVPCQDLMAAPDSCN